HGDRPAQFAGDYRRLHPVPAQEDLPGHRPLKQGARRPHTGKVGEGFAEGVLILEYGPDKFTGPLAATIRSARPTKYIAATITAQPSPLCGGRTMRPDF